MRRGVDTLGTKLVVVNPRRIEMCDGPTCSCSREAGTDVALFNGIARASWMTVSRDVSFIEGRTEGFDAFVSAVREATVEDVRGPLAV